MKNHHLTNLSLKPVMVFRKTMPGTRILKVQDVLAILLQVRAFLSTHLLSVADGVQDFISKGQTNGWSIDYCIDSFSEAQLSHLLPTSLAIHFLYRRLIHLTLPACLDRIVRGPPLAFQDTWVPYLGAFGIASALVIAKATYIIFVGAISLLATAIIFWFILQFTSRFRPSEAGDASDIAEALNKQPSEVIDACNQSEASEIRTEPPRKQFPRLVKPSTARYNDVHVKALLYLNPDHPISVPDLSSQHHGSREVAKLHDDLEKPSQLTGPIRDNVHEALDYEDEIITSLQDKVKVLSSQVNKLKERERINNKIIFKLELEKDELGAEKRKKLRKELELKTEQVKAAQLETAEEREDKRREVNRLRGTEKDLRREIAELKEQRRSMQIKYEERSLGYLQEVKEIKLLRGQVKEERANYEAALRAHSHAERRVRDAEERRELCYERMRIAEEKARELQAQMSGA